MSAAAPILVLGASGMLGSALVPRLQQAARVVTHACSGAGDVRTDLCDAAATRSMLDAVTPAVIVNLVALTDVDACERNPAQAYAVNVRSVENVVAWIRDRNRDCHLVQLSSDQVYDSPALHDESMARLTNYYAFSKYAGELAAARVDATVVRTNFFGRSRCPTRRSLSDWLHDALRKGEAITVFDDVLFSPLSQSTLCEVLQQLTQLKPGGVYNAGARDGMSKADFAFHFADSAGLPVTTMQRGSVGAVAALTAYRPRDMRMDSHKLEQLLGRRLPTLQDEILSTARDYHHAE